MAFSLATPVAVSGTADRRDPHEMSVNILTWKPALKHVQQPHVILKHVQQLHVILKHVQPRQLDQSGNIAKKLFDNILYKNVELRNVIESGQCGNPGDEGAAWSQKPCQRSSLIPHSSLPLIVPPPRGARSAA